MIKLEKSGVARRKSDRDEGRQDAREVPIASEEYGDKKGMGGLFQPHRRNQNRGDHSCPERCKGLGGGV